MIRTIVSQAPTDGADADTSILIRGKLHRGRVTRGRMQLSVGDCSGSQKFGARR